MFTKWLKEALLEVKFELTQSIHFDAAAQYITLPTHSHLSYFSVLLTAYCSTTAYVVVAKTVAHKSPTYDNTKFITTIQFPQRDPSLHIFFYLKHHRAIYRAIVLLLMPFTQTSSSRIQKGPPSVCKRLSYHFRHN